MKYLIFVLMAVCVGCAYGVVPDQQDDIQQHHPWDTAPIPNQVMQAPQQTQPDWGNQCLVSWADHYDLYSCDPANPYITVTGAPCTIQQCIVNQPCYVQTDGGMVTGTCVKQ